MGAKKKSFDYEKRYDLNFDGKIEPFEQAMREMEDEWENEQIEKAIREMRNQPKPPRSISSTAENVITFILVLPLIILAFLLLVTSI